MKKISLVVWQKKGCGHYETTDGRFKATTSYDRSFGNHWKLFDKEKFEQLKAMTGWEETWGAHCHYVSWCYEKATSHVPTLRECKSIVEQRINNGREEN